MDSPLDSQPPDSQAASPRRFATTRWSLVASAAQAEPGERRAALEELCGCYWYPLYAFARRSGAAPEEAADLTQAFFCELLQQQRLQAADPQRGRFRTFLLTCFRNFQKNQIRSAAAQKRGGGLRSASIDAVEGERRYSLEPSHRETAEHLYQRQWALAILQAAMDRLRRLYADSDRQEIFDALQPFLAGRPEGTSYAEVAEKAGMSPTAVKVAVHRLRERFGDMLRQEIRETLAPGESVDDEIRSLFAVLEGRDGGSAPK